MACLPPRTAQFFPRRGSSTAPGRPALAVFSPAHLQVQERLEAGAALGGAHVALQRCAEPLGQPPQHAVAVGRGVVPGGAHGLGGQAALCVGVAGGGGRSGEGPHVRSGLGGRVHACMHACVRACMHACVRTWMRACLQAWLGRRLQKPRVHSWAKQATVGPAENATD